MLRVRDPNTIGFPASDGASENVDRGRDWRNRAGRMSDNNPAGLDPAGVAVKRTIMSNKFLPTLPILASSEAADRMSRLAGSHLLISRQAFAGTRFDGPGIFFMNSARRLRSHL